MVWSGARVAVMSTVSWRLSLVSLLSLLVATSALPPDGEYLFVSQDYNTRCVEIRDGLPVSENCPIDSQPKSILRPFCNKCPDSYNKYEIKSESSSVWLIPDVDRLNVFQAGTWSMWEIGGCNPLLLQSFGSMLYVLCSVGDNKHRVTVYVVDVTAESTTMIPISTNSVVNPNVSAFFMKNGDVHLCVAVDNNTLLFYNVRTGQESSQGPPSCPFVEQLTPYEGADRKAHLLVECTDDLKTLTLVYNTTSAKFANASLLGSLGLGKNVLSPDGSVITRWKNTSCVFSQLQVNPPVNVEFSLNTGAIHSASLNIIQNSLVFVVAVSSPHAGLYWFNVTLALATGGNMGGPQPITDSAAVCVSTDCPGIALTDTGLVLAPVGEGRQVRFYFLSNDSHFGPIDLGFGVARIVLIRSEEQLPTHSSEGTLPPHDPIVKTLDFQIGFPATVGILAVIITVALVVAAVICCRWKRCKGTRHQVIESQKVQAAQPMPPLDDDGGVQNQTGNTELVHGMLLLPLGSSQSSSSASMPTNTNGSARQDPLGGD